MRVLNPSANEVMLRLAAALGNRDAHDLAGDFAADNPSAALRRVAAELAG